MPFATRKIANKVATADGAEPMKQWLACFDLQVTAFERKQGVSTRRFSRRTLRGLLRWHFAPPELMASERTSSVKIIILIRRNARRSKKSRFSRLSFGKFLISFSPPTLHSGVLPEDFPPLLLH
jgi:hypothetical protein